jgi:hypothetical protein
MVSSFRGVAMGLILDSAKDSVKCVISVVGYHACEGVDSIFYRKIEDISRVGKTFWAYRSSKAKCLGVQSFCAQDPIYALLIESSVVSGARPTVCNTAATSYSVDRLIWDNFSDGLSPVTAKLDKGACAFVFGSLQKVDGFVDLWDYSFSDGSPLKFMLGCSTVCAVKQDLSNSERRMKSHLRRVVGVAQLKAPYCVYIR